MTTIYKTGYNDTSNSEQYVLNNSFDREFRVLGVENLTYNPIENTIERVTGVQGNASYTLTYDGSGNLTDIDKTIGSTTYHKDLTYDGSNNLTNVSVWTKV